MLKKLFHKLPVLTLTSLIFMNIQTVFAGENPTLNRTVLLEHKVELANNQVTAKTIRVIFPPAFKTPWHTHEGPGPRYVVKGKLKVIEGGKTNIYKAGDVFWESGQLMSVENLSDQSGELIIVELVSVPD
jgi:quercetin dioxygenase-like cupin family protein